MNLNLARAGSGDYSGRAEVPLSARVLVVTTRIFMIQRLHRHVGFHTPRAILVDAAAEAISEALQGRRAAFAAKRDATSLVSAVGPRCARWTEGRGRR